MVSLSNQACSAVSSESSVVSRFPPPPEGRHLTVRAFRQTGKTPRRSAFSRSRSGPPVSKGTAEQSGPDLTLSFGVTFARTAAKGRSAAFFVRLTV